MTYAQGSAEYATPYNIEVALDEAYGGLDEWVEESEPLAEVLRDALGDEYSDASPADMEDALLSVLEAMSPAESFNFAKALKQIEVGAQQALSDPTVGQVLRAAAPVAGGALGTVIGGPAGTALGARLGTAAVSALPTAPRARPGVSMPRPALPALTGGSTAAAQALVLTQQPEVLKGLLAVALGQHGKQEVNGIPVAQIVSMLNSVFAQAAADADEIMYVGGGVSDEEDGDVGDFGSDQALYVDLLDAENDALEDAAWWS